MIVCIQCALEAFVNGVDPLYLHTDATFNETPTEHMRRLHPDPVRNQARRQELLMLAAARMGGTYFDPTK
jgi:hypothetical protein